ncbi:MAG: OmpA family protein [Sphingomonadaceae bacterium]
MPDLPLPLLLFALCLPAGADQLPAPPDPTFHLAANRSDVSRADLPRVAAHCQYAAEHPTSLLQIAGHTDRKGGDEYNFAIGQKHAEMLLHRLHACGVELKRMEALSLGKQRPLDPGHNRAADARNRRVEIHYRLADAPAAPPLQ